MNEIYEGNEHVRDFQRSIEEARRELAGKSLSEIMGPVLYEGYKALGKKDVTTKAPDV